MLHTEAINHNKTTLAKQLMLECTNCSSYKHNNLHTVMRLHIGAAGELAQSAAGELAQSAAGELAQSAAGELAQSVAGELAQSVAGEILNNF